MHMIKIDLPPSQNFTLIPNWFIDHHLSDANGDFVKVYLVLQRLINCCASEFSTSQIADLLHLTESDVIRALKFWSGKELLNLDIHKNVITAISFNDWSSETAVTMNMNSTVPGTMSGATSETFEAPAKEPQLNLATKPQYNMEELSKFMSESSYKDLIYVTGRYLGKNLTQFELATLISLHDWLGLPLDVIEWLVEYCATNDHRNMRYIEKVALEWTDRGVNTLEKAKNYTESFNKKYFVIKKALGLSGRNPVPHEIKLMDKWLEDYHFSIDIILEACNRTMKTAPNGSYNYVDKILTAWHEKNVKSFEDIAILDQKHNEKVVSRQNKPQDDSKPKNRFNNYKQDDYDYDDLEKIFFERLLKDGTEGVR